MNRRSFLQSILAACAAPAIVRADSLMRIVPREVLVIGPETLALPTPLLDHMAWLDRVVSDFDFIGVTSIRDTSRRMIPALLPAPPRIVARVLWQAGDVVDIQPILEPGQPIVYEREITNAEASELIRRKRNG